MTAESLAKLLRTTPQNIGILARGGVITRGKNDKGETDYDVGRVVGEYVEYLRRQASGRNMPDKVRKMKADADIAEMESAKLAGTLCLREDYLQNFADMIAHHVRSISALRSLTSEQKADVVAALRAVKLPPLPDHSAHDSEESEETEAA